MASEVILCPPRATGTLVYSAIALLFKFFLHSCQIGLVRLEFEPALADHPDVFRISDDKVELSPKLCSFEERSAALDAAFRKMRAKGDLESLREEKEELHILPLYSWQIQCVPSWTWGPIVKQKCLLEKRLEKRL